MSIFIENWTIDFKISKHLNLKISDSNGNSDSNSFLSRSNRGRNSVGREKPTLHLSAVAASCSRSAVPGVTGDRAYNLTMNGTSLAP